MKLTAGKIAIAMFVLFCVACYFGFNVLVALAVNGTYFPGLPKGNLAFIAKSVTGFMGVTLGGAIVLLGMKLTGREAWRFYVPVIALAAWAGMTAYFHYHRPIEADHVDRTFNGKVYHLPWAASDFGRWGREPLRATVEALSLRFCSTPFRTDLQAPRGDCDLEEFNLYKTAGRADLGSDAARVLALLRTAAAQPNGGVASIEFTRHAVGSGVSVRGHYIASYVLRPGVPFSPPTCAESPASGSSWSSSGPGRTTPSQTCGGSSSSTGSSSTSSSSSGGHSDDQIGVIKPHAAPAGMIGFGQNRETYSGPDGDPVAIIYLFEPPKAGSPLTHWAVCDLRYRPRYPICRHQQYVDGVLLAWPVPMDRPEEWQRRRDALLAMAAAYTRPLPHTAPAFRQTKGPAPRDADPSAVR